MPLLALLLMLSYPGITSHIEGWPQDLEVHEHIVRAGVITDACGAFALACAKPNLYTGRCDVYLPSWAPEWLRTHEIEHCLGGDHMAPGQLSLAPLHAYFDAWVASKKPRVADPMAAAPCLAEARGLLAERLPGTHHVVAREVIDGRSYWGIARAIGSTVEVSESLVREICQLPLQPVAEGGGIPPTLAAGG